MPNLTILTCSQCGKTFERLTYEVNRRKAKHHFCSRACNSAAMTWHNPKSFQKPRARQMSEVEAAYMAGLFDGEGTVVFPYHDENRKGGERVRIVIGMCHLPILERALRLTKVGKIHKKTKQEPHHQTQWAWMCYGPNAADVLKQMLPWLLEKQKRAAKAIALYKRA